MQVILRTACGAEQVLDLDAHRAIPHVIVVRPANTAMPPRVFHHQARTDRYPRRVYLETGAPAPTTGKRVDYYAAFDVAPRDDAAEPTTDIDGRSTVGTARYRRHVAAGRISPETHFA